MKLKKINILAAIAFGAVITFTGCIKDSDAMSEKN